MNNYLPLSGGNMTGVTISRNVETSELQINGGTASFHGGSLVVYGKDVSTDTGCFKVIASTDYSSASELRGTPAGSLTWNSMNVDVIDSQGDGWIRYGNGIQICWVYVKLNNSVYTWSFPKTFSQNPVITTAVNYTGGDGFNVCQRCVELNDLSNTGVLLRSANHLFGDTTMSTGVDVVDAIAIGRWK